MIEQNVSTLKIHRLTQEQYDRELAAGRIDENAIYLTPEEELDLSDYATLDQLKNKVDKVNGKDLSTNDYTTAEKNKLANIEEGAQINQNAFTEIYVNGQSKPAISPNSSIEVKPKAGISANIEAGDNATYNLNITNTGVLEIAPGTVNGTISVTKHNTTTNVAVKGLGSAAYTAASAYDAAGAANQALETAKSYADNIKNDLLNGAGNYMTDSQSVPEGSNFNTVTKSGAYRFNNVSSYTNAPPLSWGQMLVLHGAGDTINQLAFDYSGANAWIRGGNSSDVGGSGSWYDWKRIWCEGNSVTGAVWNDYAECRESDCLEAGYVLAENGDDTLSKSNKRLAPFAGVSSDTWGFSQGETEKAKTHIAVAGRVLVYPYQDRNNYKPGDCVCAAPGGTVDIMTREEIREWPDRIVGTVSCVPEYEEWGGGENADRNPVKVNGRIWIKVK